MSKGMGDYDTRIQFTIFELMEGVSFQRLGNSTIDIILIGIDVQIRVLLLY